MIFIGDFFRTEEPSVTATQLPETEPEPIDTCLLDQHGNLIRRPLQRIKMGFDLTTQNAARRSQVKDESMTCGACE